MPFRLGLLAGLAGPAAAALFFLLATGAASGKSATYDEGVHLLSGFRLLRDRDHDFNHEHPPLMKALAAAPVVVAGAAAPLEPWSVRRESDAWPLSHAWLYHVNDADRLLRLGRAAIASLGALLVIVVALVARGAAGGGAAAAAAGAAAAALAALEPNLLAHGALITTDLGMAFFYLATVAAFILWMESRAAVWLGATGLLWGLGLLAKFTAVALAPALLATGAATILLGRAGAPAAAADRSSGRRRRAARAAATASPAGTESAVPASARWWSASLRFGGLERRPWSHLAVSLAAIAVIALLVLNAGYGFDRSFASLRGMPLESARFRAWSAGAIGSIPIPVPAPFVAGFDHAEAGGQRWWSYLMGHRSMTGWRHYWIVALLVKTTIPLLLLAAAGLVLRRRLGDAAARRAVVLAVAPALLLLSFTISGNLKNIGLRYILPVHPFLCVLGGLGCVALWRSWRAWGRIAAAGLLVWVAAAEVRIWPDQLAYFNEIAGGPRGGRGWLLDSNLDWGQDLKGLGAWMKANDVGPIYLDYFGRACPRYYGVETVSAFEGGWIAVSATNLEGVYGGAPGRYDFLKPVPPSVVIGHSIYVWNVPRPPDWIPAPGTPAE